jgi:hypothetical protein
MAMEEIIVMDMEGMARNSVEPMSSDITRALAWTSEIQRFFFDGKLSSFDQQCGVQKA